MSDLFLLLAEPDRQGVLALADHLGGEDWWDKHRLGYGVITTVASLQHWASRLKMVASVAKCLLGERSLQFFRFRGPRCVGQRDLYPFAILFRELPVERHEELIRRTMRWPDPLADQVARVLTVNPRNCPFLTSVARLFPLTQAELRSLSFIA